MRIRDWHYLKRSNTTAAGCVSNACSYISRKVHVRLQHRLGHRVSEGNALKTYVSHRSFTQLHGIPSMPCNWGCNWEYTKQHKRAAVALQLDVWAPCSISKAELSNPAEETYYPDFITTGEGWGVGGLVKSIAFWHSSLFTTIVQYNAHITADAAPTYWSDSRSTSPPGC